MMINSHKGAEMTGTALLIDVLEEKLDEKYCKRCGMVLSRKRDFYKKTKSRDGLQHICIDCFNKYYRSN